MELRARTFLWGRKLKSKAKLESGSSYISLSSQALSSRRFQHGFHRFNLHRPTLQNLSSPGLASTLEMSLCSVMMHASCVCQGTHHLVYRYMVHSSREHNLQLV